MSDHFSLLMVCTGNICRSVMAEHVLRSALDQKRYGRYVHVDSCGISDEEHGKMPDRRAITVLKQRGYSFPYHHARQVQSTDFRDYDMMLAMTREHMNYLRRLSKKYGYEHTDIRLYRSFDPQVVSFMVDDNNNQLFGNGYASKDSVDVPDPWYGTQEGFIDTLDVIERVTPSIVAYIQTRLNI